jgi:tetratricopeptide (TPR) repeat protein
MVGGAILSILIISCFRDNGQSQTINKRHCTELNEAGVASLNSFLHQQTRNKGILVESIKLFTQAIECDSLYFVARQNRITCLSLLGDYRNAIKDVNFFLNLSPNDPNRLLIKAKFFEKIDALDSASLVFNKVIRIYDDSITRNPENVLLICERLHAVASIYGPEKVISQIDSLILKYPENDTILSYKKIIENSDQENPDTLSLLK